MVSRFLQKIASFVGKVKAVGVASRQTLVPPDQAKLSSSQQVVVRQAMHLASVINESLQLANNSTNPATKVSRLELAKAKLVNLQVLIQQHPYIHLEQLPDVEQNIEQMTREFSESGYYAQTNENCRDYRQDAIRGLGQDFLEFVRGWDFHATLQLRTPLRVLLRHGEKFEGAEKPADFFTEPWQGVWLPRRATFRDLGIDIDEFGGDKAASEIGEVPADGGDFLKFLIQIRQIVESDASIEKRRSSLKEELKKQEWADFCRKLGGKKKVVDTFFPPFITTIKGIPQSAIESMWNANLVTPSAIEAASDVTLKAIKGVGPAKLKAIRDACSKVTAKDCEFVDNVIR